MFINLDKKVEKDHLNKIKEKICQGKVVRLNNKDKKMNEKVNNFCN